MTNAYHGDRRVPAPHPGPRIKSDYFDVLEIDVAAFARDYGIDPDALTAMLDGSKSIDFATALKLGRALALPADLIMQLQVRHDFADSRRNGSLVIASTFVDPSPRPFPETFRSGRLGRHGRASDQALIAPLVFHEDPADGAAAGIEHALWWGDRLRVYDETGAVLWTGPIVRDLSDRVALPFVTSERWSAWFAEGRRADLAFGPDHAAVIDGAGDV